MIRSFISHALKVYIGQTRSRSLVAELIDHGFGEMTARGELPPRRRPWAYDNGAFGDWRSGEPFDAIRFQDDITAIGQMPGEQRPEFIVAPDMVAGGLTSLGVSVEWAEMLPVVAPLYLAVQDGMAETDVEAALEPFQGVFVGGTLAWKLKTGEAWVRFAHQRRLPCHIGRVGSPNRVRWAKRIRADSIDSCLPLWSNDNLARFLGALFDAQHELVL